MSIKVKFLNLSAYPFRCKLEIRGSTLNNLDTDYDSDNFINVFDNGIIQNVTTFDASENAQEIYIRNIELGDREQSNYSNTLGGFGFSPTGSSSNSEVYLKEMHDLGSDQYGGSGGEFLFVFGHNLLNEDSTITTHQFFGENLYFIRQDGKPGPSASSNPPSTIKFYPIIPVPPNKAINYIKDNFQVSGGNRFYFMIGIPVSPGPNYDYIDLSLGQQQLFLTNYESQTGIPPDYDTTPSNPPPSNLLNYITFD